MITAESSDRGRLQPGRPVTALPASLGLREGLGSPEERRKKGEAAEGQGRGQAGSVVFLSPSSSGLGRNRVDGGPGGQGQVGRGQQAASVLTSLVASLDSAPFCYPLVTRDTAAT